MLRKIRFFIFQALYSAKRKSLSKNYTHTQEHFNLCKSKEGEVLKKYLNWNICIKIMMMLLLARCEVSWLKVVHQIYFCKVLLTTECSWIFTQKFTKMQLDIFKKFHPLIFILNCELWTKNGSKICIFNSTLFMKCSRGV